MTNKAQSMAVPTFLRIAAIGLISLIVGTGLSEAKPKKPLSQSCTCGCEYQDEEGNWQWGNDVNFASSDCHQWKNKKQSCFANDGNLHDGRLTMCMPVDPKPGETGVQGGNGGVLDPGGSTQPGNVGGVPATGGAERDAGGGSKGGTLTPSPYGAASRLDVAGLNVMLSCQIANWKVIVITNSTSAAIAAGTKISYDAIRSGGNEHYGETLSSPLLPPGASIQRGGSESSSCTAWFRRPMLLSPQ